MSKFSTLNYLFNSCDAGAREIEFHTFFPLKDEETTLSKMVEFEPSQKSIDAILSFAGQYDVLQSKQAGNIELNLN